MMKKNLRSLKQKWMLAIAFCLIWAVTLPATLGKYVSSIRYEFLISSFEEVSYYFPYTGNEEMFIVEESGYYALQVWGAEGGSGSNLGGTKGYGGKGGYITSHMYLSQGEILTVTVGGKGRNSESSVWGSSGGAGGYNGGASGSSTSWLSGGGGGGSTDIRFQGSSVADRILVAGGGGGASSNTGLDGGNGGTSASSFNGTSGLGRVVGGGGTLVAGGTGGTAANAYPGSSGTLFSGGNAAGSGGGGGGGYYGGGGAGSVMATGGGGGGGGSSYIGPECMPGVPSGLPENVESPGYISGYGYAIITYVGIDEPSVVASRSLLRFYDQVLEGESIDLENQELLEENQEPESEEMEELLESESLNSESEAQDQPLEEVEDDSEEQNSDSQIPNIDSEEDEGSDSEIGQDDTEDDTESHSEQPEHLSTDSEAEQSGASQSGGIFRNWLHLFGME